MILFELNFLADAPMIHKAEDDTSKFMGFALESSFNLDGVAAMASCYNCYFYKGLIFVLIDHC